MSKEHILDLSEVLGRDTVKLPNGSTVELRNPTEFGPIDEYNLRSLMQQVVTYDPDTVRTEEQANEASQMLHDLAAMIVIDLPADVNDASCAAIFAAWFEKHATTPDPLKPPRTRKTTASTGARSVPGSKRSTAATRKRGSTSRRGR